MDCTLQKMGKWKLSTELKIVSGSEILILIQEK